MSSEGQDYPYPRQAFSDDPAHSLLTAAVTDTFARAELCNRYAAPIYTVIAGHHRTPAAGEALDLTHDFLSHYFLEPELRFAAYLTLPDPRPLFRAYVIAAIDSFLVSQIRRNTAEKRGGGRARVQLYADPGRYEGVLRDKGLTPDERAEAASAMDHYWRAARAVLREPKAPGRSADRALVASYRAGREPDLKAIAAEFDLTAKFVERRWAAVRAREVLAPYLDDDTPPPFERIAADLGMEPNTVRVQFHRLRGEVEEVLLRELEFECGAAGRPDRVKESAAELTKLLGVLRRVRKSWDAEPARAHPPCATSSARPPSGRTPTPSPASERQAVMSPLAEPSFEECQAEWIRYYDERSAGRIDLRDLPDRHYVAYYAGQVLDHAADGFELRNRIAASIGVHPARLVIDYPHAW